MSNTEDIVMKRVRRVHFLRQYINRTTLKLYGAGILAGTLAGVVSISNVFANMPSLTTPGHIAQFFMNAVMHTELMVQALVVGLVIVTALTIYDIGKNTLENKAILAQV